MFEIQCLDSYGNTINNFTQWDVDQKIIIPIDSCSLPNANIPSFPEYASPEVHFCNTSRTEALVVRSKTEDDGKTITASVPNLLLQEPYPLLVYVYLTDSDDVSSQKTILHNEIPIRKRAKPSDYEYVKNIDSGTAETIKEQIEKSVESAKGAFEEEGNQIISNLEEIKSNSQLIYDNAVTMAENVQSTIESNIDAMLQNGFNITPVDDGNGNVSIAITIQQLQGEGL